MYSIIQPLKRTPCPSSAYLEVFIKSKKLSPKRCSQVWLRSLVAKMLSLLTYVGWLYAFWGCAGFLQHDEVAGLRFCDVKIVEGHLDLFIHPARDKLRSGDWVLIAFTGNLTCPVRILERYMNAIKEPSLSVISYLNFWHCTVYTSISACLLDFTFLERLALGTRLLSCAVPLNFYGTY